MAVPATWTTTKFFLTNIPPLLRSACAHIAGQIEGAGSCVLARYSTGLILPTAADTINLDELRRAR